MERESLKAIFSEAAASEWTLQSDIQLQEWLEGFSQGLERRTDTVAQRLHELVEETTSVEQDLHNTLNFLRGLSNSQFIENRVYEEDETSEHVLAPEAPKEAETVADGYEGGIVPRYKEAVLTAWGVFKDQKLASRHSISTEFDKVIAGKAHRPLPFIIGTDELLKDVNCGLAELRKHKPYEPISATGSDTENDEADLAGDLAADMADGEWSDFSEVQAEGLEPAVSAAEGFKAMLEAALRGPSLFYGDGSVPDVGVSPNFFGEVGNVPSDSGGSKICQNSDRNMFENREYKIEEDDQGLAATRDGDMLAHPVGFRPLQEEGAQSWDQHQVNETPQDAESARSDSEFEFPASGMMDNATLGDGKEPILIPHAGRDPEAQSNGRATTADPLPRSLPGLSPGSIPDSSESVEQTELRGSSTGPTVPDELFRHGHQLQKPGSFSGKFSYTKGSLHDSFQRREVSAQVQPTASTSDNQPPVISSTAGRFKKTPSVLANPAVKQELRGGLFDEDEDEDDSYISQLIKQRSTITNRSKSFRSWSKIGAGRGLFDESDETTPALKDQDEPSVSEGSGAAGDLEDMRILSRHGQVVTERDELPSVQDNSASLLPVNRKEQHVDSEDESLSWSSRYKEKPSQHRHTPSLDQLEIGETASSNMSKAKKTSAHGPGYPETSPRKELDRNNSSKEADFKNKGTTLHARAASLTPSWSSDDSTTLRRATSSDHRAAQGMSSQDLSKLGRSSSRGSVQSLNGLTRGTSSKTPLLFGDEDEDDDVMLVGKPDSIVGPSNRASYLDSRRTNSLSQPLYSSLSVSNLDEEMDRTAGLPATSSEEGPRQRALMPVGSSTIGSAYISSLLFGDDDEDNEDELFGRFQKGPARTHTSLFGSQSNQTPVVDGAGSADSVGSSNTFGRADVEAVGVPRLRPSSSLHDNEARPGQPRSSLFDD